MSLDSVTLLISMGLGLKAGAPSKDSCGMILMSLYREILSITNVRLICVCHSVSAGVYLSVYVFVCTWLACDILLDLLWRLAGSPSLILSMLQPHDSMVFRDSLTGQQYASLSWKIKTKL